MGALQNSQAWSLEKMQLAEYLKKSEVLPSGIELLDHFLGGGLPIGALTEWGMPLGLGGREILIPWIRQMTCSVPPQWTLWIHTHQDLEIYPPAWAARGVALEKMRFARTSAPLKDLRPVFLEPLFKLIIIDSQQSFTGEEYAFIARQARRLRQVVIVLQQDILSAPLKSKTLISRKKLPNDRGPHDTHIWSRLRLNLWDCEPHFFRGTKTSWSENTPRVWPTEQDFERPIQGIDELRDEEDGSDGRDNHLWIEVVRGLSPRCLKLSSKRLFFV